jgi:hypothetical protein
MDEHRRLEDLIDAEVEDRFQIRDLARRWVPETLA